MLLDILYQDENWLLVNKPAGISVIPERVQTEADSINKLLEARLGQKVWVVHRLDKDTSGVLCFALNEQAHRYLSEQFREHRVGKFYAALVHGSPASEEGSIELPIAEHPTIKGKMVVNRRGKPSLTDYRIVSKWPLYSLIQLQLHTGRTHQIRVHMQSIGHPVVADPLYGDGKGFLLSSIKKGYKLSRDAEEEKPLLSRLALHAYRLVLPKPDGELLSIDAELPRDIAACVRQLDKQSRK